MHFQAQLLDAIGASVIATDPAGKIIYMNQFAAMMFGWTIDEAIGADVMDVTVPSTSRQQGEEIMNALRRGETWTGDFIAHRRDGQKFPIRATNTPLFGDAGELVAIIGVSRDISDRKGEEEALRKSEERFHATFEQAAVGISQISLDGRFERANARLCEMFGYGSDELLSLKFSDITDPDDLPKSLELIRELSEGNRNRSRLKSAMCARMAREFGRARRSQCCGIAEGNLSIL
ncbi:MAG: PAS domain-containing protein [Verrucomicrobiota bacterium]|nr:PAS domain-containing protein [Verrucomicrobiota bacterium]